MLVVALQGAAELLVELRVRVGAVGERLPLDHIEPVDESVLGAFPFIRHGFTVRQ
jgi:hypothetical protein